MSDVNDAPHVDSMLNRSWMVASYSLRERRRRSRGPGAGVAQLFTPESHSLPSVTRATKVWSVWYSGLSKGTTLPPVCPPVALPEGLSRSSEVSPSVTAASFFTISKFFSR